MEILLPQLTVFQIGKFLNELRLEIVDLYLENCWYLYELILRMDEFKYLINTVERMVQMIK